MICEKCGKEFFEDWRKDKETRKTSCRFCSRSCTNRRKHTEEEKNKISKSLTQKKEKKYCIDCGKEISYTSIRCKKCHSLYRIGKGIYGISNENKAKYITARRKKIRYKFIEKLGGKCSICGYNKSKNALEFHHLDKEKKDFNLSYKGLRNSIENLNKEIEKCILVCSNCHREIHEN